MTFTDLIKYYKASITKASAGVRPSEIALQGLLTLVDENSPAYSYDFDANKERGDFSKMFRQMDMTGNSVVNIAIWTLLNDTPLFWMVFESGKEKLYYYDKNWNNRK